jgi:hypothetical protein
MKTSMLFFAGFLSLLAATASGQNYQQAMGSALGEFAQANTVEDFRNAGNRFVLIANAEPDKWLPLYYHAHCYIMMSFVESTNPEKKDEYLDEAAISVEKMVKLAPDQSEVFVMQGLLYSARLMIDPMTRGQQYSAMSAQSIGRALGIEPDNPRARYMQIANEMGTAQFFGNDISASCEKAQKLFDEWADYIVKSPVHPKWGKEQVAEVLRQCSSRN